MKRLIWIFAFLISWTAIYAQDISFRASANTVVRQGENFYLKYSINERGSNLKVPDFGEFRILTGPSQSTSSSTQVINGNVSHSYSFTYTYVLKAPEKTGTYTLSPAKITAKGQEYSSNALTIQVVEGNTQSQNQNSGSQAPAGNQTTSTPRSGSGSFVRLNLNKTSVYQGEAIYGSFKMYLTNRNLAGFENIQFPEYKGFWTEDINTPNQIHLQLENYNGKNYYTAELKSIVLYPQRSGNLEISEGNFDIVVQERVSGGNSSSPFDAFFGRYENVSYSLKSNPVQVSVKALPGNKPASFSGAVGNFTVNSEFSHDSIDVNDAFTLKITMQGTGNFNLINSPELNLPKEFEVYDPEVSRNLSQTANGSTGSITWTYTIIPRYPEMYQLAPLEISWFNPKTQQYSSYKGKKHRIFVRRTEDFKEDDPIAREFSGSDINVLSEDIRFIKEIPTKQKKNFVGKTGFWLAYLIPLFGFIFVIFLRRKQIKERANKARIRNKKANKIAQKRLKNAKKLMDNSNKEFYNEIIKALWGYVGDKLDLDNANISRENISEGLKAKNLSEDLINKFLNIIDICEYAHFAPASEENDPKRIYQYAAGLITKLEQNM